MASVESHSNTTNSTSSSSSVYVVDGETQLDDTVKASRSRHNDEFIVAMKEDLAEWLNAIHSGLTLTADDFFDQLETGVVLCRHANVVVTSRAPAAAAAAPGEHQTRGSENELSAEANGDPMRSSTGNLTDRDGMAMTPSPISPARRLAKGVLPGRPQTAPSTRSHLTSSSSSSTLTYMSSAQSGSFHARDNLSQFIAWCRTVLGVPNALLFETEDLVSRKNERNVILCLLEVARRGTRMYGMPAPTIVRFEAEIDAEMAGSDCSSTTADSGFSGDYGRGIADGEEQRQRHLSTETDTKTTSSATGNCERKQSAKHRPRPVITVDMMSLDEMVRIKLSACTCPDQYPMIKVAEGKYRIGDSLTHIFLRILRSHVMVRIGGGWDTLDSYLDRHDPCRCNSKQHRGTHAFRSTMTSQNGSVNDVSVTSAPTTSLADVTSSNRPSQSQQDIPSRVANSYHSTIVAPSQLTSSSTSIADPSRRRLGPDANSLQNVSLSANDPRSSNSRPSSAVPDQTKNKSSATVSCTPRGAKEVGGRTRQTQETSVKSSSTSTGGSSGDLTKTATPKTARRPSPSRPSTPTTCNPAASQRRPGDERNNCGATRPATNSVKTTATQSNLAKTVGHGTTSNNTRGRVSTSKIPSASTPGKQNRSKSTGAEEIKRHLMGHGALRAIHDGTSTLNHFATGATPVVKDRTPSAVGRKLFTTRLSLVGGGDHQLLPDYRPLTKVRPPNCLRSFSVDCTSSDVLLAGYEFDDDESVPAADTASFTFERDSRGDTGSGSYRLRRSMSVQESASFVTSPIDCLDPPPEDPELNVRMEMLFEEYRKVERGHSPCRNESEVSKKKAEMSAGSKVKTKKKSGVDSAQVDTKVGGVSAGRCRSVRANSVGDLLSSPTSSCLTLQKLTSSGRESRHGGSSTSLNSRATTPSSQIGRRSTPFTPRGTSTTELRSSSGRGRRTAGPSMSSTNTPGCIQKMTTTTTTSVSRRHNSNGRATPEPHWSGERDVVISSRTSGSLTKSTSASGSTLSRSLSDVSTKHSFSVPNSSSIGRELATRAPISGNLRQQPHHDGRRSQATGRCSPRSVVSLDLSTEQNDLPVVHQQNGMDDHSMSSLPRSRIPVPVSSSSRRSSSRPRYDNHDGSSQSFALRRFDSGVDLGNGLSPTAEYGPQFVHPGPCNPPATVNSGRSLSGDGCDAKQVTGGLHSFGPDRTFADDDEFY